MNELTEKKYNCKNCGSEIILKESKLLYKCPYCGGIITVSKLKNTSQNLYYVPYPYDEGYFKDNYAKLIKGEIKSIEKYYCLYSLINYKFDCSIVGKREYNDEDGKRYADFQARGNYKVNNYIIALNNNSLKSTTIGNDIFDFEKIEVLNDVNKLSDKVDKRYSKINEDEMYNLSKDIVKMRSKSNEIIHEINISMYDKKIQNVYIPCFYVKTTNGNNYLIFAQKYEEIIEKNTLKNNLTFISYVSLIFSIMFIIFMKFNHNYNKLMLILIFSFISVFILLKIIISKISISKNNIITSNVKDIPAKFYKI